MYSGRISELARRNSMMPPHLQSSYPAETQYYKQEAFADDALRRGEIKEVIDKTAKLTFDSPASNTRTQSRKRKSEAGADLPPPPPHLQKRSDRRLSTASSSENVFAGAGGKRPRREASSASLKEEKAANHQTSYSRPGVPTPAKGRRHNMDASLNKSNGAAVRANNIYMVCPTNNATSKISPKWGFKISPKWGF